MAAGIFDLTGDNAIEQGATWSRVITWKDNADVLINNTGYSARMKIKRDPNSLTDILSLTSGTGITLGGAAGTITITITDAQTAAIDAGNYFYDLEMVSGGGLVIRLLKGKVHVSAEITK